LTGGDDRPRRRRCCQQNYSENERRKKDLFLITTGGKNQNGQTIRTGYVGREIFVFLLPFSELRLAFKQTLFVFLAYTQGAERPATSHKPSVRADPRNMFRVDNTSRQIEGMHARLQHEGLGSKRASVDRPAWLLLPRRLYCLL
jgi:hypothetical protein